ncbi:formylglycine-generating enzyme family protein [Pseudomonas neuropathica]|jgi:formylglycine-generating enzyme required for sulfatase activity|uniref:Formylglycine-generating enzyme family protein n=1 Tax=Pseudomonas neuropathica TaxID=2730425 RepID=A0ABS0BIX5_9PSED|nr:formylglycine-generating enzyme family protein [Pseudomonas neuropathica]MBF6034402.1 formylglycine-generating enzyme family protein [Pseudomonas neuropathica]
MKKPHACFTFKALPALALTALCAGLLPGAAQAATAPAPGKVFKDCKDCPEMVVLPTGTFTMGTPDDEVGREPDEGPRHAVTFSKPFAISRFQVLVGEWDAYVRETGNKPYDFDDRPGRRCTAGKPEFKQTARDPAVCMNVAEAQGYIDWLSKKTGHAYRLQSESIREYAARGGSTGPFPFPFDEGNNYQISKHANTYGAADGYNFTSPAGTFPANAFGVYDAHGNVYEWTADCYHKDYSGVPNDGRPWTQENCERQVMRGNDWGEAPVFSRSGNRNSSWPTSKGDWLGFRVVRDL